MRPETIENYLKTIYNLSSDNTQVVTNQKLADRLHINPASVTEALRKLHELKYVVYEKSYGTRLSAAGARMAIDIVRRHRVWETYLVKVLGFGWDEVHELAEELEHVKNDKLINKLSELMGNPVYDPHGDPIPDAKGKIQKHKFITLAEAKAKRSYKIMGVSDHSAVFLKYLEKHRLIIGATLTVKSVEEVDGSLLVLCNKKEIVISQKVASNLICKMPE